MTLGTIGYWKWLHSLLIFKNIRLAILLVLCGVFNVVTSLSIPIILVALTDIWIFLVLIPILFFFSFSFCLYMVEVSVEEGW